jgi:lysophospholipase L1-like esterase
MKIRPAAFAVACSLALIAAPAATPTATNGGPPRSIAAIGDSITRAACSDSSCADRPQNSWSTGTNTAVDSHLLRLRAIWKTRHVAAFNVGSSYGATMADLASQAAEAVRDHAQYATIELGENDLCGKTTPKSFRASLDRGLGVLSAGPQPVKVLLLSIENEAAHWRVLRADPKAARSLKSGSVIDCGLGYYTATAPALAKVEARARLLNDILAEVCSAHPYCLYDGGAYFRLRLKASYFSPADYQHLSIAGQRALAAAEWKAAQPVLFL